MDALAFFTGNWDTIDTVEFGSMGGLGLMVRAGHGPARKTNRPGLDQAVGPENNQARSRPARLGRQKVTDRPGLERQLCMVQNSSGRLGRITVEIPMQKSIKFKKIFDFLIFFVKENEEILYPNNFLLFKVENNFLLNFWPYLRFSPYFCQL